ncbi:acylneuraminate cytidylyltransferase family protein [Desulfitobacterium sp.]|uniref:acylneuraminate cytidylyltransferase family protein n=1 Tax=Desulfitobacterium sp. TaxID=49981 RepID=UPI002CB6E87D|nr:acylneuraminate cytidylyltransferase family protein [Desulfitobacterium sp.]HVJ50741.1 acylneuraminate cytidylyltransferase family protein [Desulfitobacterium sp.]
MRNPKILGIIPARGGSKGIPRKNIKQLGDKPLIAWTIESALKANCLDRLVLSTEDEEIAILGKEYSCEVPFKRPAELAGDNTPGIEPVLHAIDWLSEHEDYRSDYVMLLQPTSPFRTHQQILEATKIVSSKDFEDCDSLVSVVIPEHPPQWMYTVNEEGYMKPLLSENLIPRRQELTTTYSLNGAIYITRTDVLIKKKSFIVPRTKLYLMNSITSLDLDSLSDWQYAEYIVQNHLFNNFD